MALDKIQGLMSGFNPFIKPKTADGDSSTEKTGNAGLHFGRLHKLKAHDNEAAEANKKTAGLSFLKDGALGSEDALYVKGGRAGGLQNLIA